MDFATEQPIMLVFLGFSVYAVMVQGFCRDKTLMIVFFCFFKLRNKQVHS